MTIQRIINEEFHPQTAKDVIRRLAMTHRTQLTPGYSDAVDIVTEFFDKHGIEYNILELPAKDDHQFYNFPSAKEWVPKSGTLEIISPSISDLRLRNLMPYGRLASFEEAPLSLVQRSVGTDGQAVETELLDVGEGKARSDYEGKDVEGKIVLTSSNPDHIRKLAVSEFGAIGIVTDRRGALPLHREPRLAECLLYSSFWWYGEEERAFGFVISPSHGDALRNYLQNDRITVRASVDATFKESRFSIVEARIQGETEQEAIVTSHLDHPKPSAVDNASGVATSMELARTFAALAENESMSIPKRSIVFLYMPEYLGSVAYLKHRREQGTIDRIVGGVNLDMIGNNQEETGGSMLAVMPSLANYSYIGPLCRWLMRYLVKNDELFAGLRGVAKFRWDIIPFSGGSDYYIFNSPDFDIPMVGLTSWPYTYYHTDRDLPEHVDNDMLKKYAMLTGTLLYILSTVDEDTVSWLSDTVVQEFSKQVDEISHDILTSLATSKGMRIGKPQERLVRSKEWARHKLHLLRESYSEAILSIERMVPGISEDIFWRGFSEIREESRNEEEAYSEVFDEWGIDSEASHDPHPLDDAVPVKTCEPGPIDEDSVFAKISYEDEKELKDILDSFRVTTLPVFTLVDFWIDGHNSALRIADNIHAETGYELRDVIYRLLEFLEEANLIEMTERKE
ncbi:MAG: DUF4910 domain-containing protein [Candidatus Lokiarchaeota archaeon]|nr:DUF4910 domain-containing protein [Candidatus Lokiarchaeota archaeon]